MRIVGFCFPEVSRFLGYVAPKVKTRTVEKFLNGVCWMVALGNMLEPRPFTHTIRERNSESLFMKHQGGNGTMKCSRVSDEERENISKAKFQVRAKLASKVDQNQALQFVHVRVVFIILGIGLGLGTMAFMVDFSWGRLHQYGKL